jgi:DUF1009 family protein
VATGETWPGAAAFQGAPDLALICGYGNLAVEIARAATQAGRKPYMIGIEGEAEAAIREFPGRILSWGQLGKLFAVLDEFGIRQVAFAGGVRKRPELLKLKLDWGAIKALPQALAFMLGGDNTVLAGTIKLFERRNVAVVGIADIAPGLIAGKGTIAGKAPTGRAFAGIRAAWLACKALGRFDIGQAAVAENGRVVALEGIEGTDAMLARVAELRRAGKLPEKPRHAVLVKTLKPGQDLRADLPAIGPRTIEGAAAAGICGIAIEAGHSIILERQSTLALSRRKGIFIHGADDAAFGE